MTGETTHKVLNFNIKRTAWNTHALEAMPAAGGNRGQFQNYNCDS